MSTDRLLSQFDLTLSQDIVKDVQTTGVPFTKEIWGEGIGKNWLGCIILDKSEEDEVRLKFNGMKLFFRIFAISFNPYIRGR